MREPLLFIDQLLTVVMQYYLPLAVPQQPHHMLLSLQHAASQPPWLLGTRVVTYCHMLCICWECIPGSMKGPKHWLLAACEPSYSGLA